MSDFVIPVLGLGDENAQPYTVVWKDGTVLCRGILGTAFDPAPEQEQLNNVVSLDEFKERRNAIREKPL